MTRSFAAGMGQDGVAGSMQFAGPGDPPNPNSMVSKPEGAGVTQMLHLLLCGQPPNKIGSFVLYLASDESQ